MVARGWPPRRARHDPLTQTRAGATGHGPCADVEGDRGDLPGPHRHEDGTLVDDVEHLTVPAEQVASGGREHRADGG